MDKKWRKKEEIIRVFVFSCIWSQILHAYISQLLYMYFEDFPNFWVLSMFLCFFKIPPRWGFVLNTILSYRAPEIYSTISPSYNLQISVPISWGPCYNKQWWFVYTAQGSAMEPIYPYWISQARWNYHTLDNASCKLLLYTGKVFDHTYITSDSKTQHHKNSGVIRPWKFTHNEYYFNINS